jgi:biopolymer transport protein ExbD
LTEPQDRLLTTAAALIVEVDARGGVSLNEVKFGTVANSTTLTNRLKQIFDTRLRNRVFADRDGASQTHIPLDERIAKGVYLHPATSLGYADLLKLLTEIRAAGASPLYVELTRGDISHLATVPTSRSQTDLVPNPYFLLATVDARHNIELNRERVPSFEALATRLRTIFDQRQRDGALDPATKQISRAVGLRLDRGNSVSSLLDLMDAAGLMGASPIILLIDDATLPALNAVPPARKPTKPARKPSGRP